jgi:3-hydroxyacyl-CoA dehydrogenase/enoyl-CoA hydratase/3-hydroxybutyryl-CoA epimerase
MSACTTQVRDGIARLELSLPGEAINKITRDVRDELEEVLGQLATDSAIRAVVLISGKSDTFIAGADIDEFVALQTREEAYDLVRQGQALVNRIERLGKPVVAAIHGACLGGGLEAVLACTYRIATDHPKTKLGLPEVQLGIIPAAGGCQRLPRLIGVRAALDIILAGKQVPAKRAFRTGIVDELVHPAILERVAFEAAERLAGGWKPKRGKRDAASLALDKNPLGRRVVFTTAKNRLLKKTGGHYPAPEAALQAVRHGLRHGLQAGLDMEAAFFAELAVHEVSRNLVQIFFATTALKKDSGVGGAAPEPKTVTNLGIVGAGFMGSGIGAAAVTQAGVDVRFRDTDLKQVGRGLKGARKILKGRLKRRRITKHEYRRLERLLSGGTEWRGFGRADLVIEAVFEDLDRPRNALLLPRGEDAAA